MREQVKREEKQMFEKLRIAKVDVEKLGEAAEQLMSDLEAKLGGFVESPKGKPKKMAKTAKKPIKTAKKTAKIANKPTKSKPKKSAPKAAVKATKKPLKKAAGKATKKKSR